MVEPWSGAPSQPVQRPANTPVAETVGERAVRVARMAVSFIVMLELFCKLFVEVVVSY